MKMKKTRKLAMSLVLIVAFVGVLALDAGATPIAGGISFGGDALLDNFNLNLATKFTAFPFTFVTQVSGDYGAITVPPPLSNLTEATFTPFAFRAPVTPTPFQLWTLTFGPDTYSFDATSINITNSQSDSIDLQGTGVAHITGFDDTLGTWVITANSLGDTFSFSASSATVPEPATMLLLGSGLLGIGVFVRRRFKK